jgi:hypothetical protein
MYTKNKGVVAATPPGTKHISHSTYLNENAAQTDNRSNIDQFLIQDTTREGDIFGKDVQILYGDELHESIRNQKPSVEQKYGVKIKVMGEFRGLTSVIQRVTFTDIYRHMLGKKDPQVRDSPTLDFVDSIPSEAQLTYAGHAEIDIEGKQTFYPNCVLDINLDPLKWCPSGISPDGKVMPWGECTYCYASFKHKGYPYIFKVEKDNLAEQIRKAKKDRAALGLQTRYLRLGKRAEFGYGALNEQLVNTLEACLETGISVVFPTKYLAFDKQVAELLKRTKSVLLSSQGDDKLELGAVMHGCTNDWRFEQGVLYHRHGVNVVPYILVRATEEDGGEVFGRNLRRAEKLFGKAQILPLISKGKKVAAKVLGASNHLLGEYGKGLFGESHGGYEIGNARRGIPIHLHESLTKRIGTNDQNIRLCLHNSNCSACGKCFLSGEKGEIIPAEKVNLQKRSRWVRKRERYNGGELFDMHHPSIKQPRE